MDILEWTSAFIDNLNSFRRNLEKKEMHGNEITCTYKQIGIVTYIVEAELKKDILEKLSNNAVIVCLNNKENLSFLSGNWESFIKSPKLKVIFSNPKLNLQWSLVPYTHNLISDPKSLKLGLKSIFETVPEV